MRKVVFNGFIESASDFEDDITPARLHDALYGEDGSLNDDVDILVNSYGGDCNAAVRMFDELKAYPGHTHVTISGTAASAATVFVQGADELSITPGSIFMIHDPMTIAFGNKADMKKAMDILDTCKNSIIAQYKARCPLDEEEIGRLMSKETWMDSTEAMQYGFVDNITGQGVQNRVVSRDAVKAMVNDWRARHGYPLLNEEEPEEEEEKPEEEEPDEEDPSEEPEQDPKGETSEEEEQDPTEEPAEEPDKPEEPEEAEPDKPDEEPEKPEEDEQDRLVRQDVMDWLASLPY